tara:strand:- start:292 stop:987 length:696 start_codon:yes stop_codon:yes gene_type:complete
MTGALEIDGKKLYPIKVAAGEVSYSRDYVTRLAREGKICASHVGRQWFVDLDSLRSYAELSIAEQDIRKKQLSDERKRERLVREAVKESNTLQLRRAKTLSVRAAVAAVMVMTTGSVAGLTGYHFLSYGESADRLLAAVQEAGKANGQTGLDKAVETDPSQSVATLGVVEQGVLLLPASTSTVAAEQLFSDEVELRELADGSKAVVQVDNNGLVVGDPIPFVKIPVKENEM